MAFGARYEAYLRIYGHVQHLRVYWSSLTRLEALEQPWTGLIAGNEISNYIFRQFACCFAVGISQWISVKKGARAAFRSRGNARDDAPAGRTSALIQLLRAPANIASRLCLPISRHCIVWTCRRFTLIYLLWSFGDHHTYINSVSLELSDELGSSAQQW
jgi:hypothetical protein